ncbi:LamG-like jellyroll fold domain-containing protein [Micromonospora citrea]|uniref:LamG-like jellyroll fold domain-containing protein n=1 Tax=Micromonospora citrea TaxID=47855 RepID=UPI003C63FCF9
MEGRTRSRSWLRRVGMTAGLAGLFAAYATTAGPEVPSAAPRPAMLPAASEGPVRQSEAEAVAAAKELGRRVEIGAMRGEASETYANPDGTLTSVAHTQPVRIARNGRWMPVDATLTRGSDGAVRPVATTVALELSGGGDSPLVQVERAGRKLTLDWPGKLPTPVLDGDKATYPEVLPGVDLVVNVGISGFSHVLVIKNAEAARNPELAELDFGLRGDGLKVEERADGGLTAVDAATGGAVLESATPVMWESGAPATTAAAKSLARSADPAPADAVEEAPASARRAELGVKLAADKITLVPDQAMLADPTTRWPVYVDPVWQDTRNSAWAMVASGYPNEEYYKFSGTQGLGECPVSSGQCNGTGVKRLFYALPTPYAGKTILEAEFAVTMTHTYDGSAKGVALYRAGAAIGSGTNWNNQPAMSVHQETKSPTAEQSSCTSTNQNVTFNALAAVKESVTKGWSTTTFGMRAVSETDHTAFKRFCGNALLSVRYNRAPLQPKQTEMTMSPGGQCVTGSSRPYVSDEPTLYFYLRDPDHSSTHTENVYGKLRYYWKSGTTDVIKTYNTPSKASGSRFQYTIPSGSIPQNTVIKWDVMANDGSTDGTRSVACEFIYDATKPTAPDIDSPEYLPNDSTETTSLCADDDEWRGSVGTYGTFTFDTSATDAAKYYYAFNTNPSPSNVLTPTTAGGPVSVTWMPENDGPNYVTVQAVDQGGLTSTIATCVFSVPTRLAAGEWALDELAGASALADARGQHPATPGPGVQPGVPGPGCMDTGEECQLDRAVRFTGTADSYLSTASAALVDTSGGFGITAWVRLTDASRDRVAVSMDGSGEPGFTVGYDHATKKWAVTVPSTDITSFGGWTATSNTDAAIGVWTHLTAVHDPVKQTLQLYVNGNAQTASPRRSAWKARGAVQMGRGMAKSGYTDHWVGDLADVMVFDRVVVAREATAISQLRAIRQAFWPLDEVIEGKSPADDVAGKDLVLAGGATLYTPDLDDPEAKFPLGGAGNLLLDGVDDAAHTTTAMARTDRSFTISVRVRLASAGCGRNMAVVSQNGAIGTGFLIRCSTTDQGRWELVVPQADGTAPTVVAVIDNATLPNAETQGQWVAMVYDSFRKEVRLYVNGQLSATGTAPRPTAWNAAGGLQVGRVQTNTNVYGEYLAGEIDDVRVYSGVVDDITLAQIASPEPNPNI